MRGQAVDLHRARHDGQLVILKVVDVGEVMEEDGWTGKSGRKSCGERGLVMLEERRKKEGGGRGGKEEEERQREGRYK